jgi:hypothetical protein
MPAGTCYLINEYDKKLLEVFKEIVEHGFGKIEVDIHETRNMKTKILIIAGCSYVYFVEKTISGFDEKEIF